MEDFSIGARVVKSMAFFTPLPPIKSGVAHYGVSLATELKTHFDITFYVDDNYQPDISPLDIPVKSHREFSAKEDIVLYQISNNPIHAYMYDHVVRCGGIMTLHDSSQYDLLTWKYLNREISKYRYWGEVLYCERLGGIRKALRKVDGVTGIRNTIRHNVLFSKVEKRQNFYLSRRLIKSSDGVIAHSEHVGKYVRKVARKTPLMIVPHGVDKVDISRTKEESRSFLKLERHGMQRDSFVIVSFGFIQDHKRICQVLEAFRHFRKETPNSFYVLVGPRVPEFPIDSIVKEMGVASNVIVNDRYVPMEMVNEYINASDLCFNLRWPAYGSSSGTLYKIMAVGKPCVITDTETFSEFPDDMVIRIQKGEFEVQSILDCMRRCRDDPDAGERIGARAKQYIDNECIWPVVAEKYQRFILSHAN